MNRSQHFLVAAISLCIGACSGKSDEETTESTTTGGATTNETTGNGTTGNGTTETGDSTPDPSPFVVEGWSTCAPNASGPSSIVIEATVDDPQGADTIPVLDSTITATNASGGEVFSEPLLCNEGYCTFAFRDDVYGGITCDTGADHTFTIVLIDDSGNTSDPYVAAWR